MSSQLFRWKSQLLSGRNMLVICLTVFAVLCLYRVYDLWTTGFFVSDEYGYIQNAIQGSIYGNSAFDAQTS